MAKLKWFKSKGSVGVFYGLGLEEIEINFENITGLVTLAGKNGCSKTTVLEMLSPFDVFKSRKIVEGQKYNLKSEFMLRDSYKEVCYEFNGSEYIFRVEVPANTTMTPEGYITCDGIPLVKGKISAYRKKVVELFGSEELFYSSIFSCQGGEKLTDKTIGEFKQLLIELLGHQKYVTWWKSIGKVQTEIGKKLQKTTDDLARFEEVLTNAEDNTALLDAEKASLKDRESDIEKIKTGIYGAEAEVETLQQEKSDAEKKESATAKKVTQKDDLEKALTDATTANDTVIEDHTERMTEKATEIQPHKDMVSRESDINNAEKAISLIEAEKADLETQDSTITAEIDNKKSQVAECSDSLLSISDKLSGLRSDEKLSALTEKVNVIKEEFRVAHANEEAKKTTLSSAKDDRVLKSLEQDLKQFDTAEELLSRRPDNCSDDSCPFIMNALASINRKPEKQYAIADWKKQNTKLVESAEAALKEAVTFREGVVEKGTEAKKEWQTQFDFIEKEVKIINESLEDMNKLRVGYSEDLTGMEDRKLILVKSLAGIPGKIEKLQVLATLKPKLQTAKELLLVAEKAIAEDKRVFGISQDEFTRNSAIDKQAIDNIGMGITLASLDKSSVDISKALTEKEAFLKNINSGMPVLESKILELQKNIAVLEDKAKVSDEYFKKIDALKKRENHIRKEMTRWDYIRAAVSKSGLQALEIANAAPLLTGIANELLFDAFGGEFYLDLVTQDEEGREILDINVTREGGEVFPLSKYSGGEKTWILQSFKAAQIVVNTEKSGIQFQTCFCDEESGALDRDKAERFIKMYRSLMKKANFEKLFYITHMPESQALADHVLLFEKGGISSESDISIPCLSSMLFPGPGACGIYG